MILSFPGRLASLGLIVLSALCLLQHISAGASGEPEWEVLAERRLNMPAGIPLYFQLDLLSLSPGEFFETTTGDGMIYMLSGAVEVGLKGATRKLGVGEGLFLPRNELHSFLAPMDEEASFLLFHLVSGDACCGEIEDSSPGVRRLFRTEQPLGEMSEEPLDCTLIRIATGSTGPVTVPPLPGPALFSVQDVGEGGPVSPWKIFFVPGGDGQGVILSGDPAEVAIAAILIPEDDSAERPFNPSE